MSERAEYDDDGYRPFPFPKALAETLRSEFSDRFVDGMRNRMIVSFHKYGPVAHGYPDRVNALDSLEERIQRYRETGNAEWLIDAANFAMIEFMHPSHPDAHFRPTDSHESPGRVRHDGSDSHGANRPPDKALERMRDRFYRGEG